MFRKGGVLVVVWISLTFGSGVGITQVPVMPRPPIDKNSPQVPPDAQVAPVYDTPTVPPPQFDRVEARSPRTMTETERLAPPASTRPMTNLSTGLSDTTPVLRGPVHEAFAEQFSADAQPGFIVEQKPPIDIEEVPAEIKPVGSDVVWIPGYWGWDPAENSFLWITGLWRVAPPEQRWVPGYWSQEKYGWQWVSGYWGSRSSDQLVYLPTPQAVPESRPTTEPPHADSFWVSGMWVFRDGDFHWREGGWANASDDWVWVPARNVWTPRGTLHRAGYWDYPLLRRGMLFLPVKVDKPAATVRLDPTYLIDTNSNWLANLFIFPRYQHYLFGDYYDSPYRQRGIYPWVEYHRYDTKLDPLFGYYHFQANAQSFVRELAELHVYYHDTPVARPVTRLSEHAKRVAAASEIEERYLIRTATLNAIARKSVKGFQYPFQLESLTGESRAAATVAAKILRQWAQERNVYEQIVPVVQNEVIEDGAGRIKGMLKLPVSPYLITSPPVVVDPFETNQVEPVLPTDELQTPAPRPSPSKVIPNFGAETTVQPVVVPERLNDRLEGGTPEPIRSALPPPPPSSN